MIGPPTFHWLLWVNRALATNGSWDLCCYKQLGKKKKKGSATFFLIFALANSLAATTFLSLTFTHMHAHLKELQRLLPHCVSRKNTQLPCPERSKRAWLCVMKKRLTWILEVIISMQREQSWLFLYSPETCCAKALTLPKALLSPNGVETKETVKAVDTKPKRKRALAQLLAKTSSCCRSNWQAWLSTLTFFFLLSLILSCFLSLLSACLF